MTKVISKVFSASISVNGGTATKVDLSANSGVTVSYIGSNYKNYIKRMIVGDEVAYFLYTTSSASLIHTVSLGIVIVPCSVISMIFLFIVLPLICC